MKSGQVSIKQWGKALLAVMCVAFAFSLTACASEGSTQSQEGASSREFTVVHEGKLTVASDLANPPFDYMDNGVAQGFEVELMQALAQKLGLECEYLAPMKFDSIIPTIQQGGRADVGASNFTITDARRQEVDFTDAFLDSNQGLVTLSSAAESVAQDATVLDTPDTTIAVQAGTTGESWARENLSHATIVPLDDPIQALTGVKTGSYTAAIADLPVMQYECLTAYTDLSVAQEIPTGEQYGIVVSKANPALTAALNSALQECREDGTLDALETKWFGSSQSSSASATQGSAQATTQDATTQATSASSEGLIINKATARPNESGGSGVIGGMNTRLTWEATTQLVDGLSSVQLSLPEGASFEGASVRVTVLDGLNRINVNSTSTAANNKLNVNFDTPLPQGSLVRIEATDMRFPEEGGDYTVGGSYTSASGTTAALQESQPISIIANTPVQKIVNWLDEQPWVEAWNSIPFLGMFFKPQLLVTSFVSLFSGWLVCLAIVVIAYPFAIALGLLFAVMKISSLRILRAVASVYINVLRGTPLFLQIYIMFFGLPMMGININNNVLGVIVMAVNSSAYLSEIFRAGIQSIPRGQYEAAASLGMNRAQTMFSIILPQTVRRVIPTVTSDFITSYKDTSLLSSVGVMELMMFSKNLTTVSGNITPYMAAAIYYLLVTLPLIKLVGLVERRLEKAERGGGPRPKLLSTDDSVEKKNVDEQVVAGYHMQSLPTLEDAQFSASVSTANNYSNSTSTGFATDNASKQAKKPCALDILAGPFKSHLASWEA